MGSVAVVILNYNGEKYLRQFIPKLIEYSPKNVEIWVADNASTDESAQLIKSNFPDINYLQLENNYGFAGGYNIALKQINTDVFVLLNNDVEVSPDWLLPLIEEISAPNTGACQPKILAYNNKTTFEYAGAAGGYLDYLGYPFCAGRLFDTLETDQNQYNNTQEIFWASGACLVVKSEVFRQLDGFDSDFFAHMEEIDLCWRIHRLGFNIKYVPTSTIYHVGGGTLPKANPFKTYLNFRNSLFMLYKNLPNRQIFTVIFTRLILDGLAGIQFLVKADFNNILAILKAHFSFYKNIGRLNIKRKALKENLPQFAPKQLFYPKSIVFQYFINKNKVFDNLKWEIKTPKL